MAQAGVCVVRAEVQPYGVLITVRLTPDVTRSLTVPAEPTTDPEAALMLVRAFLTRFIASARRS